MVAIDLRATLFATLIAVASCTDSEKASRIDCTACPELVALEAGEIHRSNDPNPWVRGDATFGESHVVSVPYKLEISRFEVTNAQWRACIADGGCTHKPENIAEAAADLPVVDVNWHDANEFVGWLSKASGETYRLPTEAEWEYAARGNIQTKFIKGGDPATICDYANHRAAASSADTRNQACEDGFPDEPAPVGSFEANNAGLYDMLGNVWEWVEDCWHDAEWANRDAYPAAYPKDGPRDGSAFIGDKDQCKTRVMRGGSWRNGSLNSFSPHFRNFDDAGQRYPNLGFRVVRETS